MYVEAVKAGLLAYDQRTKLHSMWKRFQRWITKGNSSILIVGAGGTGKSTLAQMLACGPGVFAPPRSYRESITVETLQLAGSIPATLIVAPGQQHRRVRTLSSLLRDVTKRPGFGIIHVVANGHHSLANEVSFRELPEYSKGMTASRFLARYADSCRQLEVNVLREIEANLRVAPNRFWMLTLVTKQDLWWDDRAHIQHQYLTGPYGNVIDSIRQQRGDDRFFHEYVSASLVMQNLRSGNDELLARTTAGYDEAVQLTHLTKLFDTIERLASL